MGDDGNRFSSLLGGDSSGGGYEWDSRALYELSPAAFERVVGALYTADGFDVEGAGPTVEGGIDLIAKKSGFIRSKTIVISVIPPGGTVSLPTVNQLERGRGINGASQGILARPKPFRDAIRNAAVDNGTIELLDGQQLITRLTNNGVVHPGWR
ncbi:restriction endonuclease [Halocatena pleomorpha]|uniref:Restriction endonuclease n=1 Tax=Halocatena pleomorpha TaxID=1785090 RepID=A0A3P3RGI6_9EURY|nr:restriction endonuclease [Halocatena pleomorpha]RRJ32504.1 restriction endonuclease [Halocatena pleomorpha]